MTVGIRDASASGRQTSGTATRSGDFALATASRRSTWRPWNPCSWLCGDDPSRGLTGGLPRDRDLVAGGLELRCGRLDVQADHVRHLRVRLGNNEGNGSSLLHLRAGVNREVKDCVRWPVRKTLRQVAQYEASVRQLPLNTFRGRPVATVAAWVSGGQVTTDLRDGNGCLVSTHQAEPGRSSTAQRTDVFRGVIKR